MTLVAGFRMQQDGILLCSDSQYTGGTKINKQKLFGFIFNSERPDMCSMAFAVAGHDDFAHMAIQDCVSEIESIRPEQRTAPKILAGLRRAVKGIYCGYVDSRPEPERGNAAFELIVGAWFPKAGGLCLFKTGGPALLVAGDYHCTGIGAYLGDYLMRDAFKREMRIKECALLAIQALAAAKRYDAYCGGDTQFLRISVGGQMSNFVPYVVQESETYVANFENAARDFLFKLGDAELNNSQFEFHLEQFIHRAREIRNYWTSGKSPWLTYLIERLTKVKSGQPSPESTTPDS